MGITLLADSWFTAQHGSFLYDIKLTVNYEMEQLLVYCSGKLLPNALA